MTHFDEHLQIKRAYVKAERTDGARILVDRLWPRGLSKVNAKLALWLKEIAPTTELREWFGHDPERWQEFQVRYKKELSDNPDAVAELAEYIHQGKVTLIYGAKDEVHNHALVLAQYMRSHSESASQ